MLIGIIRANGRRAASDLSQLPPMETLLIEPIELENISVWVPGAKVGPEIKGYSHSALLLATVDHTKREPCPEEVARLLAEHTAGYHAGRLPLTILEGWRWEYSYSVSQFKLASYDLPERGGSWENCWEAVLNESAGSIAAEWVHIYDSSDQTTKPEDCGLKSKIEIRTFSAMRTRNGYPKERKLSR
jgi:hypothetical protein